MTQSVESETPAVTTTKFEAHTLEQAVQNKSEPNRLMEVINNQVQCQGSSSLQLRHSELPQNP